jgi:hypothetical protein
MSKSFIKFKPVTASSEKHNCREIKPKYLIIPDTENEKIVDRYIADVRIEIEKKYFENVGQRMQDKATPIREAVILLPDDDNDKNLENIFSLNAELEQNYGMKAFQIHIHNDEGHIDEKGVKKFNYHAHVVYNWTDEKGKSLKLNKIDLSEIQTITAKHLGMERGIKGSKSLSLNHHQFRGYLEIKDKLELEMRQELTEEQNKKIRIEILQNERNKNNGTSQGGIRR